MKQFIYEILDWPLIPIMSHISIPTWKKLCLYKHKIAHELNIY